MSKQAKVQISGRALTQRINRALAKEGQALRSARSERDQRELGSFFIIDLNRNAIEAQHCDLVKLGRELGVLKAWEVLEKN